jgi:hypothetical protein
LDGIVGWSDWDTNPVSADDLVGGLEHEFYDFPYIGNVIIPTDELIFFRGVGQPPTSDVFLDTLDVEKDWLVFNQMIEQLFLAASTT